MLVAAPTGSGKTVVGEFAIHLALATGRKAFYTTPIKALSNQKYNDLVRRYGEDQVGLLTGDNTVNGEAPVVVMTTEVLRNMLYAGSRTLLGLGYVVMDEVHYLADRDRGAVWEEIIIHLPESVALVSLSATVSNAEEFGEWLETVRGDTTTIVEERRPVPLYQHVMVSRRLHDLFASSDVDASAGFVKEGAPVNGELMRVARDDFASSRLMRDRRSPRKGKPGSSKNPRSVGNGRRVWIPSRVDVIDRLEREGLLPAIVFIFSRVGCDAAVTQCLAAGVRLTTPGERDEIYQFVEASCRHLPDDDLHVLGYHDFLDGLTRGVALPPRGDAAGVQGVRRAAVRPRAVQGRLRHRDPRARHQHARPHGGHREAHQVERRGPRRHHAGGVHPAHRAGRPPGPRCRGACGGALAARHEPARAGRPGVDAHLPAPLVVPAVVQHGGQPRAPVRPRDVARAARAVLRPVPGRQGRGRAGPAAAQERGRARRLPRRGGLRPGRLHGVRRAPAADLRPGEGGRAGAPGRPARGGARLALPAQARGRDRGAGGKVRRVRRRRRPGRDPRRAAALRRHRRAPGATAGRDRLPDACGRADPAQGAAQLQRPQPADASRPGVRAAHPYPRPRPRRHPAATATGAAAVAGRGRPRTIRSTACASSSATTRATSVPSARTTPGGPSDGSSSTATPRPCGAGSSSAPTPWPASSTGCARC